MHAPIDVVSVGQHPLVWRLLRGAFQSCLPLPRYTNTWDVNVQLTYLNGHEMAQNISLRQLTLRTIILLALTHPSWSTDLAKLNLTGSKLNLAGYKNTPEEAVFLPTALAKQSRTFSRKVVWPGCGIIVKFLFASLVQITTMTNVLIAIQLPPSVHTKQLHSDHQRGGQITHTFSFGSWVIGLVPFDVWCIYKHARSECNCFMHWWWLAV